MSRTILIFALLSSMAGMTAQSSSFTKPADFFGFEPGSDRNLITYEQQIAYLEILDEESPRIKLERIGTSSQGKPMYIAFISSEENIENLSDLKVINRELALNDTLGAHQLEGMISSGKVFVLATLSMHSSEVAPSQSVPLITYEFASTADRKKLEWLHNVVYMMVPCHNPDGMDMIVENYKKYLATPYEGASLPRVYHKYVGHDINRDFVVLTQTETKAVAGIYNQTWFPQVMVEKHQMGSTGPRYFVPPNHDPIAENVPAGIYQWGGVFGQHMATDMTVSGLEGVSQHYSFDDYWPGSTETCIWKNVIGFLTEAASVRTATPVFIEPTELRVSGKGLSEYKKGVNMLLPWEGGWWHLGNIVEYEIASTMSIIKTASLYREDILEFRNRMCREQVALGKSEAPFYYILPQEQHDPGELVNLANLMMEHGIRIYELEEDLVLEGTVFHSGDVVIPLAQPFRAFIKEVLERQEFPERHYAPGGELIKPYDITSWSLPLHRDVTSHEIEVRSKVLEDRLSPINGKYSLKESIDMEVYAMILTVSSNESFRSAFKALENGLRVERLREAVELRGRTYGKGSFVVFYDSGKKSEWEDVMEELPFQAGYISDKRELNSTPLAMPRIALVESYFHDMDAGWTRYILDTYHVPFEVLHPGQFQKTGLSAQFDVIIFPSNQKEVLMTGKRKAGESYSMSNYHPDFVKGIEKEGFEKLMTFSDQGGIVIAWGNSTSLFNGLLKIKRKEKEEEFELPFNDISSQLSKEGLYVPGSLVKMEVLQEHPVTLGMPESIGVFSRGQPVFTTSVPMFDMDRKVLGTYPEKDVLMSGYAAKEEKLGNRAAMIWLRKGKGQFVLFGFNPQFRASTQSSFKLFFNAMLLGKIE